MNDVSECSDIILSWRRSAAFIYALCMSQASSVQKH